MGRLPRRKVEAEYLAVLRFEDEFELELAPEQVGTTSVTYGWEIGGRATLHPRPPHRRARGRRRPAGAAERRGASCARGAVGWRQHRLEERSVEDFAGYLGTRSHGHALRPRRLPAGASGRADRGEGASRRHGPGRPDGRLRVPLPGRAEPGQPRRGARGARRSWDLRGRRRATRRRALPAGRAHEPRRQDPKRSAADPPRSGRPRRRSRGADDHLAGRRGLQLSVPGAVRGNVGAPDRRHRPDRGAARSRTAACSSSSTRTPSRR